MRTRGATLRESDGHALAVLAEWHAVWLDTLAKSQSPDLEPAERMKLLQQLGICSTNFERLAKRFGLTPADRAAGKIPLNDSGPAKPKVLTRPRTQLDTKGAPK